MDRPRCADCGGEAGGDNVSLKACKACMLVKYCNVKCQRNHWPKHKKDCKRRAAELRDEALFKDPPAKEDFPICFLPMPVRFISCVSLPYATLSSVPIYDYAIANEELAGMSMEEYYPCCEKSICRGCVHSICMSEGNWTSGNDGKCPFCKAEIIDDTENERVERIMKRVEANDAGAMCLLANYYLDGRGGFQQDHARAMELYARAAVLGLNKAHYYLATNHNDGGNLKKAKIHYEAAAMAGHEVARFNLGSIERNSGNMERAVKHWTIAASAGDYLAMHYLKGVVRRNAINSIFTAYNNSCAEMRSEARNAIVNN